MSQTISKKTAKLAIKDNETRKGLNFNRGNIANLTKLSINTDISNILRLTGGRIVISIIGDGSSDAKVVFDNCGGKAVSLQELVRVLNAPQIISSFLKEKDKVEKDLLFSKLCAVLCTVHSVSLTEIQSPTLETITQIKSFIGDYERLMKNFKFLEDNQKILSEDPLIGYMSDQLKQSITHVTWIVAELLKGNKPSKEEKLQVLMDHGVTRWFYKKMTTSIVQKGQTPLRIFFPRKVEKGITLYLSEIKNPDFIKENKPVTCRSVFLIKLLENADDNNKAGILTELLNLDDFNEDSKIDEIINQFQWNLFPPVRLEDVDDFLDQKGKVMVSHEPMVTQIDISRRLKKLNNSLLRASMLEVSTYNPHLVIIEKLFNFDTVEAETFRSTPKQNFYDKMKDVDDYGKKVILYLNLNGDEMIELFAEIFGLEYGLEKSKSIALFKKATNFESGIKVNSEDGSLEDILPYIENTKVIKDKHIDFLKSNKFEFAGEYSSCIDAAKKIAENQPIRKPKPRNTGPPLTKLTQHSKRLVEGLKEKDLVLAENIRGFLQSFSLAVLQSEALNLIHAQVSRSGGFYKLLDLEENIVLDEYEEDEMNFYLDE